MVIGETSAEPFLQARKRGAHPSTILLTCSPWIQMIIYNYTGDMVVKILDPTDHLIIKTYDHLIWSPGIQMIICKGDHTDDHMYR